MLRLDGIALRQGGFSLSADFTADDPVTAVIGPSGSGKSTLLGAIAGFVDPVDGRILWQGEPIHHLPPFDRPVAMLFQDGNLFPHLTVGENLALALGPRLDPGEDGRARIAAGLERVGLSGLSGRKPGSLSGGQRSRAALARALLQDRPLVLLDEAFGALGPALKDEMLDLSVAVLREAGRQLLLVTHDPEDAKRVAGAVIAVAEGRAFPPAPTADFFADPPAAIRTYLG